MAILNTHQTHSTSPSPLGEGRREAPRTMEVTRFIIAGNVDDGKSTLTGRLLHDSGSLKADAVVAVTTGKQLNLAHITDGLRAERQQGITIDVAYKYFTTESRKFIVIDAPGHFRYTHNLVTGASGAHAMVIIVDVTHGVTEQTRRHALVASFLGIQHVVVAVNKMDLVGYSVAAFNDVCAQFSEIAAKLQLTNIKYIPISALQGDNVVTPSADMPWHTGPALLQYLDKAATGKKITGAARFPIQFVVDTPEGKGYAGLLYNGSMSVGDQVVIYPNSQPASVTKMLNGFTEVKDGVAGQSLTIFLDGGDADRGKVIAGGSAMTLGTGLGVLLWWLDGQTPLQCDKEYLLRVNTQETTCTIASISDKIDINTFDGIPSGNTLQVNELAHVVLTTKSPVACDIFKNLEATGRGILIDKETKSTLGAFVIEQMH